MKGDDDIAFKDEVGSLDRIAKAVEQIAQQGGGSGGGGLVIPTFTVDEQYEVTCDMTNEEIFSAIEDKTCIGAFVVLDESNKYYFVLQEYMVDGSGYWFKNETLEEESLSYRVLYYSDGSLSYANAQIPITVE